MKRSEIAKLLTVIEATEKSGRRPSEEDVELWLAFATEGGWESYDAALRAYVVYRSRQPDYPLRPGHITTTLAEVRTAASKSFDIGIEPVPASVAAADDFDAAYLAWVKERAAGHRARYMAAFARNETPAQRAIGR